MKLSGESSPGVPTIEKAFPALFFRSTAAIESGSFLLYAASLLRFHVIEAAMILVEKRQPMQIGDKVAFISGYPIVTTLQKTKPQDIYKALFEPCHKYNVAVKPTKLAHDLRDLLLIFKEARFGFTAVTDGELYAMVGLSDVLGLYRRSALSTDLTAHDVASEAISVEPGTTIKDALNLMLERRIRRVFIKGTNTFVSDREVVSYIFSPRKLQEVRRSPGKMLDDTVLNVGPVEAPKIEDDLPLREAASLVVQSQGGALTCNKGVVSPWDIVMKPFATGHLDVESTTHD